MGIDRPYEDNLDAPASSRADEAVHVRYETRDRETYYEELREAVAAGGKWVTTVSEFRSTWASYTREHPSPEAQSARESPDGSWTGNGNRHLDQQSNADVDRGCDRVRETEETIISPAMRRIESEDPTRSLVGFEHRLKGSDRIKEKVADQMQAQPELTGDRAVSLVKDLIRYTFQYKDPAYSSGVRADSTRLQEAGFHLVELRNFWGREEYKGINSRWREPTTGQLFEVQFHTQTSFEAKQLTHGAYERLRDPLTPQDQQRDLMACQRRVCDNIPVPRSSLDIPDFP